MKAILVLDKPSACEECPLHTHVKFDYYYDESICMATGNEILDTKEVHRMCPLKPMDYFNEVMEKVRRLEKELFE